MYIKFTGDYSKLKTQGFKFQKLFAGNYMQWCNNGFRVWKKGAELTIDGLTNYEGVFLQLILDIRDKKIEPTYARMGNKLTVIKHFDNVTLEGTKESIDKHRETDRLHHEWWMEGKVGEEPQFTTYTDFISLEVVKRLLQMYDSGMIKLS